MATIKRGTTPTLRVKINVSDVGIFDRVDFLFKQGYQDGAPQVLKTYPSGDVELVNGVYVIKFSEGETRVFVPNANVLLDVRPVMANGGIPRTPIKTLQIAPTLYGR